MWPFSSEEARRCTFNPAGFIPLTKPTAYYHILIKATNSSCPISSPYRSPEGLCLDLCFLLGHISPVFTCFQLQFGLHQPTTTTKNNSTNENQNGSFAFYLRLSSAASETEANNKRLKEIELNYMLSCNQLIDSVVATPTKSADQ